MSELEDIVSSQGSLINKLQEECKKLANQLEDNTVKFKYVQLYCILQACIIII